MAPAVDRLVRRVRRLERLAVELQELAVDLVSELTVIRRVLAEDASGRLNTAVECAALKASEERRRAALKAASVGAWKLETRPGRSGAMIVRFDEGKWFRLTRVDARLLMLLAKSPAASDGFPSGLTYDEIGAAIAVKAGKSPTRRALIESVFRIRKALKSADLNPYLVHVDAKSARARLLLRVGSTGGVGRPNG